MNPDPAGAAAAVALTVVLLAAVLGLAAQIWYALALSRVFARSSVEPWRAWVPVLNEAEILRLGGREAWEVVYYFIPVVSLYGLVLKALAARRIGARFGRGAGTVVLAILVPPVWATLLAWGRAESPAPSARPAASAPEPAPQPSAVPALPPSPFMVQPPPGLAEQAPRPPEARPAGAPMIVELPAWVPPAAPVRSSAPAERAASALPATPVTAPVPPVVAPAPAALPPVPSVAPAVVAPAVPEPQPAPPVPASAAPLPTSRFEPQAAASLSTAASAPPPEPAVEDELDETIVVDRGPKPEWELVLDEGEIYTLHESSVVVGRRPGGTEPGVQYLAVADTTRTLSKQHARFDFGGGSWTVTDLNSTNGVLLGGSEQPLAAGTSAELQGRIVLGEVGLQIRRLGEAE